MKRMILFLVLCGSMMFATAQKHHDCFSVVVGREATADGSVLFAHNEDDYGKVHFNMYRVPTPKSVGATASISASAENEVNTAPKVGFHWLEMPGMDFSDSFMNDHGVVIASDACASREDRPELSEGGVTWQLRYAMASEANSARHAVMIATELLQSRGYNSSGRTYIIADPNEAWMLSVVYGKHYVAKRIPDSCVAIIPNYYTITDVNLEDEKRVIASPDIIQYAISRGWYDPEKDGDFNFRKAYGSPESLQDMGNIARMWAALNLLSPKKYEPGDDFPWVFKPGKKIELASLMSVLSNHYENTKFDCTKDNPSADKHTCEPSPICGETTQYGFVAQLRSNMPTMVGCVLWLAPFRPCTNAFFPIYLGADKVPDGFEGKDFEAAIRHHMLGDLKPEDVQPNEMYSVFVKNTNAINSKRNGDFTKKTIDLTLEFIRQQPMAEKLAQYSLPKMEKEAVRVLNARTQQTFEKVLKLSNNSAFQQP
jgi:dipeptidase